MFANNLKTKRLEKLIKRC